MSYTGQVYELDWAWLVVGKDELSIIQKDGIEDCPKIRFVTKTGNSLGAISWNRGDTGHQVEQILLQGKLGDEQDDNTGPMLRVDMNRGGGSQDKDMQPYLRASWKEFWCAVPIVSAGGVIQPPNTGGPMLDFDMRNDDNLYRHFVDQHEEFRSTIAQWFLDVNGRAIDPGSMAMMMFRALIERNRWVTLRAALTNVWPK